MLDTPSHSYYNRRQTTTIDMYNYDIKNQLQHAGLGTMKHNITRFNTWVRLLYINISK